MALRAMCKYSTLFTNMEDSYTVSMPLDPNVVLNKSMSPKSDEE